MSDNLTTLFSKQRELSAAAQIQRETYATDASDADATDPDAAAGLLGSEATMP